jgi:serine/threonine-protein kinase Chk2
MIDDPIVSNRHCLIFTEHKGSDTVAILEDLSSNGTFVNEAIVGRNQRRELQEQDEIAVLDKARFIFRYPKTRQTSAFLQQYTLLEKLGKGHFAEVFLCIEKSTGQRYAVKVFTKHPGTEERSKTEGLQQEIAVLMGVSHPNVLCLKDTFNERNAVYLVLELAPEGELFNFIVMKQKLTEDETRKLFVQLFQGIKYLVGLAPAPSSKRTISPDLPCSSTNGILSTVT